MPEQRDALHAAAPSALPDWRSPCGARTARLLRRSLAAYALVYALGVALVLAAPAGAWRHVGLGLLWPGAGFWAPADGMGWADAPWGVGGALLLGLFPLALLLWFGTGNALAPPVVWGLAALAAGLRAGSPDPGAAAVLLWLPPCAAVLSALGLAWWWDRARASRARAQSILQASAVIEWRRPASAAPPRPVLDAADLQRLRFAMDRALQPLDRFEGFDWLDPYQTAAVRYQLNFLGYALAMAQARALPAAGGDLERAQQRLVLKLADHRIWRYWASESLWGHARHEPDPTARDNIMYTGFGALQMALFQSASGRRDWLAPGSLTLVHPRSGAVYPADLPTLALALRRDLAAAPLGLMACEPNWVYPLCNSMSAAALQALQAQTGEPHWTPHAAGFRQALLQEFMAPSGHFVPCRSSYTGLALPVIGGVLPAAMTAFFLNALWPDLALQQWALLRRRLLARGGVLNRSSFWAVDLGNYRRSRAAAWAGTALAAREMGDTEVAGLCLEALDTESPACVEAGYRYRPGVSTWTHALELMARYGGEGAFRGLVHGPAPVACGPRLAELPYPQVVAASAFQVDGGLELVLDALRPGPHPVVLSGLQALRAYRVEGLAPGLTAVADEQGRCELSVDGQGRRRIAVRPGH